MRRLSILALFFIGALVGYVGINHTPDLTPTDSIVIVIDSAVTMGGTVVMWTVPSGPPVALALRDNLPVLTESQGLQVTNLVI